MPVNGDQNGNKISKIPLLCVPALISNLDALFADRCLMVALPMGPVAPRIKATGLDMIA